MARQYLDRLGFIHGIKPSYNALSTPKTAIWEGRNVDVDDIGVLRVRSGSAVAHATGMASAVNVIKGVVAAFDTVLGVWGQDLYKWEGSAWAPLTNTNIFNNENVTMEAWSESGAEVVYLHDGAGIWKTDGTTCDLITPYEPQEGEEVNLLRDSDDGSQDITSGPAQGRIVLFRHGLSSRMAIAHDNTVYLSAPDNPAYFPYDQMFRLPDDGGQIVNMVMAYGALIIFRDTDVWAFYGSSVTADGSWLRRQSTTGCVAAGSVQEVPGIGIMYLSSDNIYVLQGVSGIEDQYHSIPIGDDIVKYLKYESNAASVYYDREYILSFPSAAEPERVFRFKPNNSAWYIDSGPRMERYFIRDNKLYFAERDKICRYSRSYRTDNGLGISFEATFSHERLSQGPAKMRKVFIYTTTTNTVQKLQVSITSGGKTIDTTEASLAVPGSQSFKIGVSRLGEAYVGRYDEIKIFECRARLKKGTFFQISISGTVPDQEIGIIGYSLEYKPKQKMKGIRV